MRVDLNADMGESFGDWRMGDDAALLDVVTSANVACGMHAGDWDVMADTMRRAAERGVEIGAHPGFPDLQGFGRRHMAMAHGSLRNLVTYQVGAAMAAARAAGGAVRHVKLHGAMANMASEDEAMARAAYEGALAAHSDAILLVIAGTAQERAAKALGAAWAGEVFADRGYRADGTLVPRGESGAMVHDPDEAAARMAAFVRDGAVRAVDGTRVPVAVDSICLHGDGPTALAIARAVRAALEAEAVAVTAFGGRT